LCVHRFVQQRHSNARGSGTLTGVVLSDGKPWLVTAAHLISRAINNTQNPPGLCSTVSICPPPAGQPPPLGASILNNCPHYTIQDQLFQPSWFSSNRRSIGTVPRWTQNSGNLFQATADVAAAFMDNNSIEGDGSLSASREIYTYPNRIPLKGESIPVPGTTVYIYTGDPGSTGVHVIEAAITGLSESSNVLTPIDNEFCVHNSNAGIYNQIFHSATDICTTFGDSGSPIVEAFGNIVGMHNWSRTNYCEGGGTQGETIKRVLGFDMWYTQTVKDNSIGLFRPSNALWSRDNGNGKFDGCGAEANEANATTKDYCYGVFGAPNTSGNPAKDDIAVTGDWDGDINKTVTMGVYHQDPTKCPNPASQCFQVSNSNFPPAINLTLHTAGPEVGYRPVVGKWLGPNSGRTKLGVFSAQSGVWYLESGDGVVNGCATDYCFDTYDGNPNNTAPSNWTRPGDIPLAGDWNKNGTVTIGVFRPSTGYFHLSNTELVVGAQPQLSVSSLAVDPSLGYGPVVGNWTGMPGDKVGLFNSSLSRWYLDNGNLSWPSCVEDQCSTGYLGFAGDQPAVFGKTTVRAN
jgi:hypothetical protein